MVGTNNIRKEEWIMTALGICKVEFYKSNRLLFSIAGETETYKTFIKTDP